VLKRKLMYTGWCLASVRRSNRPPQGGWPSPDERRQ